MGRPLPYQPMHTPKPVSYDRMAEIIERRSAGKVRLSPPVKLEWCDPVWTTKPTHGHMFSKCDRYMIDKAENSYSCYLRGVPYTKAGKYLGGAASAVEAKELCQEHANR